MADDLARASGLVPGWAGIGEPCIKGIREKKNNPPPPPLWGGGLLGEPQA